MRQSKVIEKDAEVTISFSCGALVRGAVKAKMIQLALRHNIRYEIEEHKSLLSSIYVFRCAGAVMDTYRFLNDVSDLKELFHDG